MPQAEPDLTTLGPGQQILDPNLLTQIQQKGLVLSPTDLLKIASFYKATDLSHHLFLIALKIATRNQTPEAPSPASPPVVATSTSTRVAMAAAASPLGEWQDQLEDFLCGNIDSEDNRSVVYPFQSISTVLDIRWLSFSSSHLSELGLLVETSSNPLSGLKYYVIGLSPNTSSLPTE